MGYGLWVTGHSLEPCPFAALVFAMLLDVVEAEGEDLDDDLKEDFGPVGLLLFLLFLFHKDKI
jgi:hypothetical protein